MAPATRPARAVQSFPSGHDAPRPPRRGVGRRGAHVTPPRPASGRESERRPGCGPPRTPRPGARDRNRPARSRRAGAVRLPCEPRRHDPGRVRPTRCPPASAPPLRCRAPRVAPARRPWPSRVPGSACASARLRGVGRAPEPAEEARSPDGHPACHPSRCDRREVPSTALDRRSGRRAATATGHLRHPSGHRGHRVGEAYEAKGCRGARNHLITLARTTSR